MLVGIVDDFFSRTALKLNRHPNPPTAVPPQLAGHGAAPGSGSSANRSVLRLMTGQP